MRKLYISAVSAAVLLLLAASCTPETFQTEGDSFITMKLSSGSMETKATKPGEGDLNENLLNSVYYFFYKDGEETESPVVKGRLIGLGHKNGIRTEEVPITSANADELFDSSDDCQVFIVANPPKDLNTFLGGTPTLAELRAKMFQTTVLDGIQDSFTMVYDSKVEKDKSATSNVMTVEASLKRLACKFTISLDISQKIGLPVEWQSIPADAKVEFHNAFNETSLAGDFAAVRAGDSKFKEKYFTTAAIDFGDPVEGKDSDDNDIWKCNAERPVYTYPMSWDFVGSQEPYLLIELPWKKTGTENIQLTYYKVFFNTKSVSSNSWCQLNIDLDKLGGFQKDSPTQLFENMEYLVLDWNEAFEDGNGPTTDIDGAKYLMMNTTEFWLYNQDTWNFPYTSSHECIIVDETYEKDDYRNRIAGIISGDSRDLDTYECTLNGSLITFHHELNNDINSFHYEKNQNSDDIKVGSYDVVPYTFKFTIKHKDDDEYRQEVIVHQYPAIYIEAQPNSKGVNVATGTDVRATSFLNIDPALVDNAYTGSTISDLRYYHGYGGDPYTMFQNTNNQLGNTNGNMYVVTTSTAPDLEVEGKQYMLADPRQFEEKYYQHFVDEPWLPEDNTAVWIGFFTPAYSGDLFLTLPALYDDQGTGRTPKYYYPAKDTRDAENLIAPKLRIASSWGQCGDMSYEKAVRRCAAYQEDGYPAGRWRLPTAAEVMYIVKLSSDHMIPMLFGQFADDDDALVPYWCSTGLIGVYNAEKKDGTLIDTYAAPIYMPDPSLATERTAARCVYDEWYWENRDYSNGTVATTKGRLPEYLWGTRYWGDMRR